MNIIKHTLISLFIACPLLSIAQPIILTDAYVDYTRITNIDKSMGKTGMKSKTSIKARWGSFNDVTNDLSLITSSGKSGKLVKLVNQGIKIIELPYSGSGISDMRFSINNDLLMYWDYINDYDVNVKFYDLTDEKLFNSITLSTRPFIFSTGKISRNGTTIAAVATSAYLYLYQKQDEDYSKTEIVHPSLYFLMLSEYGNRVYFRIRKNKKYCYVYVEKKAGGWSEEILIPNATFPVENDTDYWIEPAALANDGKTLVVQTNNDRLALVYEIDGHWSEPEYVGDSKRLNFTLEPEIVCSEDGRVIAVQQPKYVREDYGTVTYDVFVFIKNQFGEWSKHQINLSEVHVEPGIKLTRDGSKLLWVPSLIYSSAEALEMK
jgi:hypothetical protein